MYYWLSSYGLNLLLAKVNLPSNIWGNVCQFAPSLGLTYKCQTDKLLELCRETFSDPPILAASSRGHMGMCPPQEGCAWGECWLEWMQGPEGSHGGLSSSLWTLRSSLVPPPTQSYDMQWWHAGSHWNCHSSWCTQESFFLYHSNMIQ